MPDYHQYVKLHITFHNTSESIIGYQEIRHGSVVRITDSEGNTINSEITGPYDSEVMDSTPDLPIWAQEIITVIEEELPPEENVLPE